MRLLVDCHTLTIKDITRLGIINNKNLNILVLRLLQRLGDVCTYLMNWTSPQWNVDSYVSEYKKLMCWASLSWMMTSCLDGEGKWLVRHLEMSLTDVHNILTTFCTVSI